MPFKYFPRHICMGFLIFVSIFPDPGQAEPFATDTMNMDPISGALASDASPGKLLDEDIQHDLGPDIFTFSTRHYEQTGLGGYESSVIAGFGRHLFESENLHFDMELGAGQRIIQPQGASLIEDPVIRFGLRFSLHPGDGPLSLRHDLTIETDRSSTASESMITWSYAVNPRLALELTSAVRKRPSVDPLEVPHRASFTLEWAF